jgi:hypothetical protein
VLLTAMLDEYPASNLGKVLSTWRVADQLRDAKGSEVIVTSLGVEERQG